MQLLFTGLLGVCVCVWGGRAQTTVKMKTITHPHLHASAEDEPCESLEGV